MILNGYLTLLAICKMKEFEDLKPLFNEDTGNKFPIIIAGPCSAESRTQIMRTAEGLVAAGIRIFRAGVWKPRTRPGSFEGIGARALSWLGEVRDKTGMIPVTEVASPAHLRCVLRAGINAVWIGARTVANPFAVQDIADFFASLPPSLRDNITVLVKNPVNPDLELWIGALQRLYASGIRRLGAIHRGFSAYGDHIYRNVPEWRIPIELKHRIPSLPLICDPSHIGGRKELVFPVSQQAVDMNFDGLIIESHCDPDSALSDSEQQVTPASLSDILSGLRLNSGNTAEDSLRVFREEIDAIDDELVALLARRMSVAREIGKLKLREGLSVVQQKRYGLLMDRRVNEGSRLGLSAGFMKDILGSLHEESVRQQLNLRIDNNGQDR